MNLVIGDVLAQSPVPNEHERRNRIPSEVCDYWAHSYDWRKTEARLNALPQFRTDGDQADLFVGYQAAIGTEKQFTSYNTDWGYGGGWYRGGWYGSPGGAMTTGQNLYDLCWTTGRGHV